MKLKTKLTTHERNLINHGLIEYTEDINNDGYPCFYMYEEDDDELLLNSILGNAKTIVLNGCLSADSKLDK